MAINRCLVFVTSLVCVLATPYSVAGPFGDDLAKCLVRSTTAADKVTLVQWIYATLTLHPQVKWMSSLSEERRLQVNEATGQMLQRVLTQSCLREAQEALKQEGPNSFEQSFNVLGQVSTRELMTDSNVANGFAQISNYVDAQTMERAFGSQH